MPIQTVIVWLDWRNSMTPNDLPLSGLLDGETALVTGGARGIGRAIAHYLARAGAAVAVADLDGDGVNAVATELKSCGARAVGISGDVTRDEDRRAMVEATEAQLGPLGILINNAGIIQVRDMFDLTEADWDRLMDINVRALFFLSQLVAPQMVAQGKGNIVNLASIAGKTALERRCIHYNASKAAVIAITRTMGTSLARDGVRVNCVCPGIVDTDMWTYFDHELGQRIMGLPQKELMRQQLADVPMGRAATADDVAQVILFLVSPLSSYMTGQAVNISGGLVTF
jgi:meso-butanediol dehydrogenase / (S,S)-butanediol dehydrogenase / diacetyl reductase